MNSEKKNTLADVSVVLISKQQAWNIRRLIASIPDGVREIVLVDSASTDATCELARSAGVHVIRLRPEQRLTAAAGRYVGARNTDGKYILFLDGDMQLYQPFVDEALTQFASDETVAAIVGQRFDVVKSSAEAPEAPRMEELRVESVKWTEGAAIYRREALDRAGNYNPFLFSDEEPELSMRVRHAGYRIVQINRPMVLHYTDLIDKATTKIARARRNLYLGFGQCLRYHLGDGVFGTYVRERGYGVLPLAGLAIGLAAVALGVVRGNWIGVWLWMAVTAVLIGAVYWKRGIRRGTVSIMERALIAYGTVRGFLMRPTPAECYPELVDHFPQRPCS